MSPGTMSRTGRLTVVPRASDASSALDELFQQLERVLRAVLLKESKQRVDDQEEKDDRGIEILAR